MNTKSPTKKVAIDKITVTYRPPFSKRLMRLFHAWQKVWIGLIVLSLSAMVFVGLRQQQRQRRTLAAQEALWPAEAYLREGQYTLALEGGGGDMGLLEILSKYEHTAVVNLVHYYAAVAYLNKPERDEEAAIAHLKAFQCKDSFMQARVWALLGDIYCEQKAYQEAIAYYQKAAQHMPNPFTTPIYLFKAAVVHEALHAYEEAERCYVQVYTLFPNAKQAEAAIKHAHRLKQLAQSA